MKLSDILENLYGVRTDMKVNPLTDLIGVVATSLLVNNPNRLAWTLINLSDSAIYIAFTPSVSVIHGIYVAASGGTLGLLFSEDFELVTYPIWGMSLLPDRRIYLVEVLAL